LKIEASFLVATLAVVLLSAPETLSFSVIFVWLLISLAVFDARLGRLPHLLTYSLAAIGLLAAVTYSLPALNAALLGVAVGAIAAIVTATVYKAFAGRDGLGGGDIRMIAATGAWLGWEGLPSAIFVASATAILFVLWTRKPSRSMRIAFGPFIALGALIVRAWQMAY
jgi:leader peptidase (prepilin peptidase)/N-methyltransferase